MAKLTQILWWRQPACSILRHAHSLLPDASAFLTRRAEWADPTDSSESPCERDTPASTSNAHIIAVALTRIYVRRWDQIRAREQIPFPHQERRQSRGPRCCLFTPPVRQSTPFEPCTHAELHREPRRFLGIKARSSSARGEEEWRIRAARQPQATTAMLLLPLGRLARLMERPQPESSPGASP